MRQLLLLLSVLLLGACWAAAQDSSSQPSPSSSSPSQSSSAGQSSAGGGSETTVQGCLSGSNGSYTISDKNGTTYQLTGDTAKLSEHVGHEVKVTGTASAAGSTSPSSGGSAAGASSGSASQQSLQISSVKHVSKTCQSGGGMSK
jgi:hypothetical protein